MTRIHAQIRVSHAAVLVTQKLSDQLSRPDRFRFGAAPHRPTLPRLEVTAAGQRTVVEQRRNRRVMQTLEPIARRIPREFDRVGGGRRCDERHSPAGRQINDVVVVVHDESISDERHRMIPRLSAPHCKKATCAKRSSVRGGADRAGQKLRLE